MLRSDKVGTKSEKELMKIAFDNQLDHVEKIRAIHGKPDSGTAKFLTSYLLSRLTDGERNALPIRKILIESKLKSSDWAEAIVLIDRLNPKEAGDDDRAQLKFWKGWALAANGNLAGADKTLALLASDHPKSDWRRSGQALRSAMASQSRSLAENVRALEAVIKTLGDEVEVLEATLNWDVSDQLTISVYFNYRKAAKEVQLFVRRGDEVRLAYVFNPERSRMYTGADRATLIGEGNMPIFTPEFKVSEAADGQLNLSVNGKSSDSLEASKSSLKDLLQKPLFGTRAGITRLVGRSIAQGWIPTTTSRDQQGRQVHEWIRPQTDRAKFTQLRITTAGQGMLRSIETDDGFQLFCQYGKADEITLRPPAWPTSRETVLDKRNFGIAMISKLLPAIMEIGTRK